MKILLLGGTGAMGVHLSKILAEQGRHVSVTTRRAKERTGNITYLTGSAKELGFLTRLLQEKWDVIVDFMIYNEAELEQRVEMLLDATEQYIFISSARVYDNSAEWIKESTTRLLDTIEDKEYLAKREYALTKARQENILKKNKNTNWTIVRPYITYSEQRLQLGTLEKEDWLFRALEGKTIVFSEDLKEKVTTLTYGYDVAKSIAALMGQEKSLGESYHITSSGSYTWQELLGVYLDVFEEIKGSRPTVIFLGLKDFIKLQGGRYQIIYDRMYHRKFDNEKINEFVDVGSFVEAKAGLTNCLKEFLVSPHFQNINWRSEGIKDRLAGEHTSLLRIEGALNKLKYALFRYVI
ncbi:sugar nucleotide-binding protein [Pseudomonas stutzeri]|uniref:Epimerase n=1 Tax=Stutzerimonas stutzeri TaxID=316 RepID=A0A2N8S7F8_STUST|nr:sugar nucleotide-binding protein [Stutzerimonas stutzeri]MCQ4294868.1 sugar nucleotide-binding protein [Stutzerimonas stutzeri]PNF82548.1 epimerase [Stutzerimonas stutzeri]